MSQEIMVFKSFQRSYRNTVMTKLKNGYIYPDKSENIGHTLLLMQCPTLLLVRKRLSLMAKLILKCENLKRN